jgi:RNA polymerase sigma-70 factor, ECF subfamily
VTGLALDSLAPTAPTVDDDAAFGELVERHRRELHRHCSWMLKSSSRAEDAVQETLLRAWRARASFGGRAELRSWLHQIASNVCLDEIDRSQRRARPFRLTGRLDAVAGCPEGQPETVAPSDAQPDAVVVARESLEQACLAVIALLPPRQRAVLVLCDVLRWSAVETASLLGTSVAAVTSALQRARVTLDAARPTPDQVRPPTSELSAAERLLLSRYVDVLGRPDVVAAVELVRADAAIK